jgi:hypothetical protein
MPTHGGELPRDEIQQRMENDQPLIGTPALDLSLKLDLPFRSDRREQLVATVRHNVRERRKAEKLVSRIDQNAGEPIRQAFRQETQEIVREGIANIVRRGGSQ